MQFSSRATAKLGILLDSMVLKEKVEIQSILLKPDSEKRSIHIVGNSHSHSFTGSNLSKYGKGDKEGLKWDSYNLGPLSSKDFMKYKLPLFDKVSKESGFSEGDKILLTFGEAECRRYALREVNKEAFAELRESDLFDLLEPYIEAAQESIFQISKRGFKPIVWGGHAASWVDPKDQINMPTLGTPEMRNQLSKIWHQSMKSFAMELNFPFFSMLPITLRDNYSCDEDFLADPVHLKPEAIAGYFLAFLESSNFLEVCIYDK